MALLYEKSAVWRAIVHATRNPRVLTLFAVVTVGGAYVVAKASRSVTDKYTEETEAQMKDVVKRDKEAARYAAHSKKALAAMFDNIKQRRGVEVDSEAPHNKNPIKLPGLAWHPMAVKRDREAKEAAMASTTARNGTSVKDSRQQESDVAPQNAADAKKHT